MASKSNLDKVKSGMNKSGDLLGDLVFWSLRDVAIAPDKMKALFKTGNLDEGFLPPEPANEFALIASVSRHRTGEGEGYFIRKIVKDDNRVVYGVVESAVVDGKKSGSTGASITTASGSIAPEDLKLGVVDKIVLDRKSGVVSCITNHDLSKQVIATYTALQGKYTAPHVSDAISNVITANFGLPVRESGGVYFVPGDKVEQVRALSGVINQVGLSTFSTLPIYKDAANQVVDPIQFSLESEVRKVVDELKALDLEEVSSRIISTRITRFQELENKATLYAGIMDVTVKDMLKTLGGTKQKLAKQLGITSDREDNERGAKKEAKKAERKATRKTAPKATKKAAPKGDGKASAKKATKKTAKSNGNGKATAKAKTSTKKTSTKKTASKPATKTTKKATAQASA